MARHLTLSAAQLGPIGRDAARVSLVHRMINLLRQAKQRGSRLVIFPELALTSYFPRWYMTDQREIDAYFETELPGPQTAPLFDEARRLEIGFYLGYAELATEQDGARHFNSAVLVAPDGKIIGKYRKIHLPGHSEYEPHRPFQVLEKRYFDVGNLGWPVWRCFGGNVGMCICNDRRWPETYRVMGLQDVELILIGYNTPELNTAIPEPAHHRMFHHFLTMQAGAYQNGAWVVAAAKAGLEEGTMFIGGTCVIAPSGEILARANTLDDELLTYEVDLDATRPIKSSVFNLAKHRRPEHYSLIVDRVGAIPPVEEV